MNNICSNPKPGPKISDTFFFLNINIWSLRRYIIARLYVKRVDNCSMGMWYFLSRYYSILYADNIFYPMNNNCFLAHVEGWNKDKKTIRTDELISRGCDRLTFGYLWCNLPLPSLLSGSVWGSPVNKDNVAPQVRHLVKLPKPGPVYCGAVKATRQPHKLRMIYSTAAVMNADFNDTYEDKKQDGWKDASLRESMAICAVVHLQNHNHKTFHCSRCTEINFKKKICFIWLQQWNGAVIFYISAVKNAYTHAWINCLLHNTSKNRAAFILMLIRH